MSRRARGLMFVFTIVLWTAGASGTARTEEEADPGLQPGDVVSRGLLSVEVPPLGEGAWAQLTTFDGQAQILGVETSEGTGVVIHWLQEAFAEGGSDGVPDGACSDGAYGLNGAKWTDQYQWFFKASSTPENVEQDNAETSLRDAASNITQVNNDCDLTDTVWASHWYQGTTSKSPNIGSTSNCTAPDGDNIVGFGDLGSGDLAISCWWTSGGRSIEADVKFNKTEHGWYATNKPSDCNQKWSIEAVATHEFGHVFGLDHVSESGHPSLTMSPSIGACQGQEKSLGLGDYSGLEALY